MAKGKYRILDETIFTINQKTGQRELKQETLEQVLDEIAECFGGYSICRGGIIMFDTDTDPPTKTLVTLVDGTFQMNEITD